MKDQTKRDISHDLSLEIIKYSILGLIICMFICLVLDLS